MTCESRMQSKPIFDRYGNPLYHFPMSIVAERFHACISGRFPGELTAQNVSFYHSSPFSIYCEKFVDPVFDCNEDDCRATKFVKDWLDSNAG